MSIILDTLGDALMQPIRIFFSPQSVLNIYTAFSAFFIGFIYYCFNSKKPLLRLRLLRRIFFPKSFLLHPSALFDYRHFIISRIFFFLLFFIITIPSTETIAEVSISGLTKLFGPASTNINQQSWASLVTETIVYVLVFDFAYWLHHRLHHKYMWLWEFHKPHHSAQVLTIFTSTRNHPLEEFLRGFMIVMMTALAHGVFLYINGSSADYIQIGGQNIIMFAFYISFYHLRHTQIWLPVTGFWGHIVHSPAHHQLHHSTNPRHFDKNFGFCLSLWDWVFGTLYIPETHEKITYGIGKESSRYNKLLPYLFLPFINNYQRFIKSISKKSKPL